MARQLLEGEQEIRLTDNESYVMTGRQWAGEIISCVAGYTEVGSFPQNVSAFDLGRALSRALINCNEQNAVEELIRGINHGNDNRAEFRKAIADKEVEEGKGVN